MKKNSVSTLLYTLLVFPLTLCVSTFASNPYDSWENGPPSEEEYFPIGVWLQNPAKAPRYQEAGINFYIGLWQGPTEEQLDTLKQHNMPVFCDQNEVGLAHKEDPIIQGWIQQDEPDNAQPKTDPETGETYYGPPVDPKVIIERYETMKERDPTRPVFLNLGQGVANDEWVGRGSGFDNDSYYEYAQGCDILSFDVYPVVGIRKKDGENYLWYVAKGLDRLKKWSRGENILWNIIECTHISNPDKKATPHQVKAEVWMSLIHGSKGIVYFVHQFEPTFNESALLDDQEMLDAVTAINEQIHELAPVLNTENQHEIAEIESAKAEVPVDMMVKTHQEKLYLFAVGMRNESTQATLHLHSSINQTITNLETQEEYNVEEGKLTLEFDPYEVKMLVCPWKKNVTIEQEMNYE